MLTTYSNELEKKLVSLKDLAIRLRGVAMLEALSDDHCPVSNVSVSKNTSISQKTNCIRFKFKIALDIISNQIN